MARAHLTSLILRCPAPAGAPRGGPNPLSTLLRQLHSVAHIIHDHALAYSFLCVASALPLLYVPRFPFHDSTGSEHMCMSLRKNLTFWRARGHPCSEKLIKHKEYQHLGARGVSLRSANPR